MKRIAATIAWLALGCTDRAEVLAPGELGSVTHANDISIGVGHACAIADGNLACWGQNGRGQLGTGDDTASPSPRAVAGGPWRRVASGGEHSCALDELGQIYCWGANDRGQLGQGDRLARPTPTLVPLPQRASAIASKFGHNCALLIDAELWCWGQNGEGELGQADLPPSDQTAADGLQPVAIGGAEWRAVDTGDGHTCGIRLDGALYCWGRNSDHELGSEPRIQVREPVQVTSDGPWLVTTAGQNHTCGIRSDASLWCWGDNTASVAGEGYPLGIVGMTQVESPTRVGAASDWEAVHTNTFHSCALNRNHELWCWGRNVEGQLGTGDVIGRESPTRVTSDVALVSAGRFSTCAITTDGQPRCTGMNEDGQLGTGDVDRRQVLTPVRLDTP